MDIVAQMFTQVKDTSSKPKDPSVAKISKAAVLLWDQRHLTRKGKQSAQANKISAIKHKGWQNPSFQQQQKQPQGQQPQQSADTGAEKKKSCHGKKGKGKSQDHAHIASAVFFPTIIGCAMGKLPNRSFPPSEHHITHTFKLIHSEIKSFPTESYHRYQYIITFVDDYMSMAWTTPLHTKDAALVAIHHFLKMVSIQFKTQVEQWMSNAGGEYKSESMCHEACIPESWWEFLIAHATHVYNHTPLCCYNWQTPFEVLHGSQPDIAHLCVFGCTCYTSVIND